MLFNQNRIFQSSHWFNTAYFLSLCFSWRVIFEGHVVGAFKVPLQTYRNANIWRQNLRSEFAVWNAIWVYLLRNLLSFIDFSCGVTSSFEMKRDDVWLQENSMQPSQFCHVNRWSSVLLTDFHFAFLFFSERETQSEPWRKGGIEGANLHGSNLKEIFTPTSVKENCKLSHTAVCRIHFVKAQKHQAFFFFFSLG